MVSVIPPAPPPSGINNFGGVSSAHADNGSAAKWVRFDSEFKSRQDYEAERGDLIDDPVVGAQMKQGRCVKDDSPAKP
jgi:hypothetical protein